MRNVILKRLSLMLIAMLAVGCQQSFGPPTTLMFTTAHASDMDPPPIPAPPPLPEAGR